MWREEAALFWKPSSSVWLPAEGRTFSYISPVWCHHERDESALPPINEVVNEEHRQYWSQSGQCKIHATCTTYVQPNCHPPYSVSTHSISPQADYQDIIIKPIKSLAKVKVDIHFSLILKDVKSFIQRKQSGLLSHDLFLISPFWLWPWALWNISHENQRYHFPNHDCEADGPLVPPS